MENNIYKMMELKFLLNNEGKLITRWSDETKSSTESKVRSGKWKSVDKQSGQTKKDRMNDLFNKIKTEGDCK